MLSLWARRSRPAAPWARAVACRRDVSLTSHVSEAAAPTAPPRNPHGVQLLPRRLRPSVFPPGSCDFIPESDSGALKIAQAHLRTHGLTPDAASVLPEPEFPMIPPLVGDNLAEHFWRIGASSAQPWLGMAHILADASLPTPDVFPRGIESEYRPDSGAAAHTAPSCPPRWVRQPGWTRYEIQRDTSGRITHLAPGAPVPYPPASDGPLVFDVETLAAARFPAVLATASSDKALYSWLSPWLFEPDRPSISSGNPYTAEEKDKAVRLIPLGSEELEASQPGEPADASQRQVARLIVGHNVGYDRIRVRDEYTLAPTPTRWLDTMSLHAATAGIASPQRQTWKNITKRRTARQEAAAKARQQARKKQTEAELLGPMMNGIIDRPSFDPSEQGDIDVDLALADDETRCLAWEKEVDESIDSTQDMDVLERFAGRNWIDVASSNSLAEVAKLHCNISLPKEARNVFMEAENKGVIMDHIDELLAYCASDVSVTHRVFKEVWPAFSRDACPHPATLAGVFQLGSTRLPVDREWDEYLKRAEDYYLRARSQLDAELASLAERVRVKFTQGVTAEQAQCWAEERKASVHYALDELKRRKDRPESESRPLSIAAPPDDAKAPWATDPWLRQLDWSPKHPRLPRPRKSDRRKPDKSAAWWRTHTPKWYRNLVLKAQDTNSSDDAWTVTSLVNSAAVALIQPSWDGQAIYRHPKAVDPDRLWRYMPATGAEAGDLGRPVPELANVGNLLSTATIRKVDAARLGSLDSSGLGTQVLDALRNKKPSLAQKLTAQLACSIVELSKQAAKNGGERLSPNLESLSRSIAHLDWSLVPKSTSEEPQQGPRAAEVVDGAPLDGAHHAEWWPKWYWDLAKEGGKVKVSMRNRPAPLLMSMTWHGKPLCFSRQHGWVYRMGCGEHTDGAVIADNNSIETEVGQNAGNAGGALARGVPVQFTNSSDISLLMDQEETGAAFFKVPHEDGASANVGSPFGKSFLGAFEEGVLASANASSTAKAALDLNAFCSYWISARQRVLNQLVIWDGHEGVQIQSHPLPIPKLGDKEPEVSAGFSSRQVGLILPQVVQMGTVTRRAIEQTWLTASNAKKTRVGSELKAMVKSPPGWSIVGADVDSEELWICSVLGDAQFGHHGSTAIGWMTLEGTKALGTDLHSKTASILGTSRNDAKVFNYSRIYGAGVKHATQLLLKADPSMDPAEAMTRAKDLYKHTKGERTPGTKFFDQRFWHGGSESFVFNKLESIAVLDRPRTPVLGCGVTTALSRAYLPTKTNSDGSVQEAFLPSRVNWVVQSSGVDYLHLLLTAMDHLCRTYGIEARFLLSFHDDVRYLVRDEDVPRAALALQVANLWTRSMFAYMLEMDDLPLGCAFFSQVDVDKVLRKEPGDPCVTPSHTTPVAPGTALTVEQTIEATGSQGLGKPVLAPANSPTAGHVGVQSPLADHAYAPYTHIQEMLDIMAPTYPGFTFNRPRHRAEGIRGRSFLYAQSTPKRTEIAALDRKIKALDAATDRAQLDLDAQQGWKELAHELSLTGSPLVKRSRKTSSRSTDKTESPLTSEATRSQASSKPPADEAEFGAPPQPDDSSPTESSVRSSAPCPPRSLFSSLSNTRAMLPNSPATTGRPSFAAGMSRNGSGRWLHTLAHESSSQASIPSQHESRPSEASSRLKELTPSTSLTAEESSTLVTSLFPSPQHGLTVPFFRRPEHKKNICLLYRNLLRLSRRPLPSLVMSIDQQGRIPAWIAEWVRHHRGNTSPAVVAAQIERAMNIIETLEMAHEGNGPAQVQLSNFVADLARSEAKKVQKTWAKEHERPPPRPRPTGGVLAPTASQPLQQRMSPQPLDQSRPIGLRRKRSEQQTARQLELVEVRSELRSDETLFQALRSHAVALGLWAPEGKTGQGSGQPRSSIAIEGKDDTLLSTDLAAAEIHAVVGRNHKRNFGMDPQRAEDVFWVAHQARDRLRRQNALKARTRKEERVTPFDLS